MRPELKNEYLVGRVKSGSKSRDPVPESLLGPRIAGSTPEKALVKMVDAGGKPAG